MNWLAHLFLAESNIESRLGNLLGDLVKGTAKQELNPIFNRGLNCHLEIDRFTDSHAVVKRSKQNIDAEYRRFSGILIDVFYDHFLANNWQIYSTVSLDEFTSTLYGSLAEHTDTLPIYASGVINRLIVEDWLGSYRNLIGIENTLKRISWKLTRRRKKEYNLVPAIAQLTNNYTQLERDFKEFFPELIAHIDRWHDNN